MRKIAFLLLIILFTTISFSQNGNVQRYVNMEDPAGLVNPDGFYEYKIIKGDCLWFIADEFYKDPFNWTKIHKANPYIIDPDWIYPNNWLVIPNVYTDANGNPLYSEDSETSNSKTWVEETDTWGNTSKTWGGDEQNTDNKNDVTSASSSSKSDLKDNSTSGVVQDSNSATNAATATTVNSSMDSAKDKSMDGKIKVDNKSKDSMNKTTTTGTQKDKKSDADGSCSGSYCGKPGWKLGLHAGYPLGSAPEDENLNLGLLLGTPLGVKAGPLSVGLGAGVFTYNFDTYYFGGGILASLCINDLLNLDIPLIFQLHGLGLYIFGEDQGPGFGGIGSVSIPLGNSPVNIGLYGGLGKYYPGDNIYNWGNAGAVLFYSF